MAMTAQPWWPLSPWLSPGAAWFIFFNAVVAAIAVISSCAQQQEQDRHVPAWSRRRLCRSTPSTVLDQLRSFSLFSAHPTIADDVAVLPLDDFAAGVPDDSDYGHCSQEAEVAPQVTQVPMVEPETPKPTAPVAGESVPTAAPAVAPSAPAATARPADESGSAPESKDEEADAEEEQDESISLDEAYAMVQRQRCPQQSSSSVPTAISVVTTNAASWPLKKRDPAAKGPKRRARSGGRGTEETSEGKAELNARAELFIRQFREELKLQRLNSLLRHTHAFGSVEGAPVTVR